MHRHFSLLLLAPIALFTVVGCTTTEQANAAMESKFVGQTTDSFFVDHGPPAASHNLDDGRVIYLWAENPHSVYLPGSTTATVNVVGNTAWVNGWTSSPSSINVQCQVRIISRDGKIEKIVAQSDSVGWWQLSRCNEIFG